MPAIATSTKVLRHPNAAAIPVPSAGEKPGAAAIAIITSASARVQLRPVIEVAGDGAGQNRGRAGSQRLDRAAGDQHGNDGASAQTTLPVTNDRQSADDEGRPPQGVGQRPDEQLTHR